MPNEVNSPIAITLENKKKIREAITGKARRAEFRKTG
jgi:hypothetical protein